VIADDISHHPTLRALAGRVRARWLLRTFRRGLLIGAIGTALISLVGRGLDAEIWPVLAIGWALACLVGALVIGLARTQDEWRVAREADALGLAERVTSTLHARASGARVADLVERDARAALGELDPSRYAVYEGARAWRAVGVAGVLLTVLLVMPFPRLGQPSDAADAQRVTAARQRVEAMQLQPPGDQQAAALQTRSAEQVQALRDALARSSRSQEAARAIEQTQQQLARLPSSDDYAARRSIDAAAQALESQPDSVLIPLARALRAHDEQAVQQALSALSNRLDTPGALSDAQRADAQLALQAAANAAAGSQPELAGAMRRAASSTGSQQSRALADKAPQSGALADKELRDLLSQDAADAAALDKLEQTTADLGQLRAATLPAGATLVAATGTPTAYALLRGTPPPNATPLGVGLAGGLQNAARGQAAESGPPGSGASPNGSHPYDPVYAPSHLGGDPGPQVQIDGQASDARGASVDLPQGPLSAGDVRPYDQVYADYAQEARQSAARQSLPPNVQGMVDRYFGAIAPTPGAPSP
jgi:hypothetical protein